MTTKEKKHQQIMKQPIAIPGCVSSILTSRKPFYYIMTTAYKVNFGPIKTNNHTQIILLY